MSITSILLPQQAAFPKPAAQEPTPKAAKEEPTITASASQNGASPSSTTQTEAPKETAATTPAATPVSTANQSSKPTSQSVVVARSKEMLSSGTQEAPEATIDEDAARAAAEAYRAEARQTAILESISTTPNIAEIGLKEIEESDSSESGNAYSTAKTDTDTTRNQISSERPPLDKVA